jgi:menaquinone-specific isochorismate synthase
MISPSMDRIPTGPLERDGARFMQLLEAVRDAAIEDGHWKLVSISLGSERLIDPLAVLESIYETGDRHCYIEQPEGGEALAGAEAIIERTFTGAARFEEARDFARELFEHSVAVGQLDLPMSGPKLFCAFTFEDSSAPEAPFAPATLFVPRWQVSARDGAYVATANLLVTPDGDLEEQARRALDAHRKFSTFAYARSRGPDAGATGELREENAAWYRGGVEKALGEIRAARCSKIVIARSEKFVSKQPLHPLATLARLRNIYPSCHCFSFAGTDGLSFIGSTPERLARVENGMLDTEAIAGTAPRGANSAEDAGLAADLMGCDKQMREHMAVAETIAAQLAGLGLDFGPMQRPRLLRLANAQHIRTPFRAAVPEGMHIFDIAAALHPTPATAGLPRESALDSLREIEGSPRGLYAGLTGWTGADGEGELVVALRSGFVRGHEAILFAGAGIVDGSDPVDEENETRLKMSALAKSLG